MAMIRTLKLTPLLVLGILIAWCDGCSRAANTTWEEIPQDPFGHQASWAALLLAAVSFIVIFALAEWLSANKVELLLVWFVFNTAAYAKDFAYIKVPGLPIYVTDVVLLILLIAMRKEIWADRKLVAFMLPFVAWGAITAGRSLFAGNDTKLIFRDSAIIVYPLFAVAACAIIRTWKAIRCVMLFAVLGAVASTVAGLGWFIAHPEQRRLIFEGIFVLVALIGVLSARSNGLIEKSGAWALICILSLGVFLTNARTLYVDAAALPVIGLVVRGKLRSGSIGPILKRATIVAALCSVALVAVASTDSGGRFVDRTVTELVSGVFNSDQDDNAIFRFAAWGEALNRFSEHPVVGEGFGIPFTFEYSDSDPRPHNTYLTVLYKMGAVGAAAFGYLLVVFFTSAIRTFRIFRIFLQSPEPLRFYLYIIILVQAAFCMFGGLNLLLESPFTASFFWINLGIGCRAIALLRESRLPTPAENALR